MGLFEDLKIRIQGKPSRKAQMPIAFQGGRLSDSIEALEKTDLLDLTEFNKMRQLATDKESQYRLFDEMEQDSVISSALELYADDATQYDAMGKIIWAESDNPDIAAFANRLIDAFHLGRDAWSHMYNLVKYGDLYIETFRDYDLVEKDPLSQQASNLVVKDTLKGSKLREYVAMVPNPAEIYDLRKFNKTVGFVKVPIQDANPVEPHYNYQHIQEGLETQILPPDKYVHICLSPNTDRFPESLSISFNEKCTDLDVAENQFTYNVARGKSILADIYKTYRELRFMEDAILLNRVTRSSLVRLLQIEVGDMPKNQARELLRRVKQLIEQKNYMDKDGGTFNSMAAPGPIDNVLYIPTHGGIGNISASNLGGDVNIGELTDLDYFKNKLYAGLKIPKQFLGDTDDAAGFSGGSTLTKLDARYARTIKRIQTAYVQGIQTLINMFAIDKGLTEYVNEFTIRMTDPNTTEEADRNDMLSSKLGIAGDIMNFVGEKVSPETTKEITVSLLSTFLGLADIADMVAKDEPESEEEQNEEGGGDFGGLGGGDFGGGGGSDFGGDFGGGDFGGGEDTGGSDFDNDNFTDFDANDLGGSETGGGSDFDTGATESFGDFSAVADASGEFV